jgi:amino acid adenylation domain-containing protein/thioester reductase-like protein
MQQGMMFHTLLNAKSGDYFEQIHLLMHGNIDKDLLHKSWEYLLDRHTILRTSFNHDTASLPLQIVHKKVALPWTEYDWQDLDESTQQDQLKQLLDTERHQGFQLDHAPLMRCQLIRLTSADYRFIWNHHHLLMDGWCLQILFQELMIIYGSLKNNPETENPLPAQPQPFRNYIKWLQNQDETAAAAYWQKILQGFDTPNTIPLPPVSQAPPVYKECELRLSPQQTSDLMQLSRSRRLTLNTLLQGAWGVLLNRYCGDTDIVFGVTVSGRQASLEGIHSMLGLFINTLPLRIRDFHSDLITYLQNIQKQQQENERHGYLSLADIQKSSDVQGHHALFETLLVFENFATAEDSGHEDLFTIKETKSLEQTNYPLTLMAVPGNELLLKIFYDSSRFSSAAIKRMIAHLQIILAAFSTAEIHDVSRLTILTPEEQDQIRRWNSTSTPIPRNLTLTDMVEDQAGKNPDLPAIAFHDQIISYRQMDGLSNHLAHRLLQYGVLPDSLVVVSLERSPEMIIAVLAVLKAGGAYVPVDPDYPEDRIEYMLEDSRTKVVITTTEISKRLPQSEAEHICLDLSRMTEQAEPPAITRNPGNLAYMIYTSGSTGRPKGVCCAHTGVINLCDDFSKRAPVTAGMAHSFWTSLSFDVSVYEIFTPLLSGGCLHIVPQETRGDGAAFCKWLAGKKINNSYIPPFMLPDFDLWLQEHPEESSLVRMLVGVEPIEEELLASFMRHIPGLQIINGYGPTEATICSTLYSVDKNSSGTGRTPIGQAVQNSDLYVLNHSMQPVPVNIPGELYIGGTGLARGYWQRDDLTGQAFISSPFFMEGGSPRLYRTGDLVRRREDGNLEFIGRIDHQVKVRGFRIELGEIETCISQSGLVRDNVVTARKDGSGSRRLIAYVATGNTDNDRKISEQLQLILAEKLPSFMVPSMIIELEKLPLTPSGKLDRKGLPEPARPAEINYTAPESPLELELVAIWEKLLDVTGIGINDNFFDLGGHSLLTVRLLSRINKQLQHEIPMDHFFKNPTVSGIVLLIEAQQTGHEIIEPADTVIDLQQEAVLSEEIKGSARINISPEDAENIFITGATGFVGAFLLKELLLQTSAKIHCLVRAKDPEEGKTRIRKGLQFYKLWDPLEEQRIIPVTGDLAAKKLGIEAAILKQLEDKIDLIYHNGAFVHHMLPYSKLKTANVGGTHEVLKLACSKKLKPVHFISTLNIFSSSVGKETCTETTGIDREQHFESQGYAASKWVSEKLVSMAGERGLPVNIYRLGLVTGDSRTGACNGDDHLDLFIRSCIRMGCFPAGMPPAHIVPVDILAGAIVHLSKQKNREGTNYHLFNPEPVPSDRILGTYRKNNKGLQKIDAEKWFAQVEETMETAEPLPLVPYLPMYKKFLQEYLQQDPEQQAFYSCKQTMEILARDNIHYPELSDASLNAYFQFLSERNLL